MVSNYARAATETEAANLALGHLGLSEIADLKDDVARARAAKQFFAMVRDSTLREKWWSFARAWTRPMADVNESIGPIKTRYPMPENCLRIRYLADDIGNLFYEDDGKWETEAAQILDDGPQHEGVVLVSDIRSPLVSYTRRIEEVRVWSPDFLKAFSFELASMMGRRLGRSRTLGADLHARAQAELDNAATIDSKEKARKMLTHTPSIISARQGWRSPGGKWRWW